MIHTTYGTEVVPLARDARGEQAVCARVADGRLLLLPADYLRGDGPEALAAALAALPVLAPPPAAGALGAEPRILHPPRWPQRPMTGCAWSAPSD